MNNFVTYIFETIFFQLVQKGHKYVFPKWYIRRRAKTRWACISKPMLGSSERG